MWVQEDALWKKWFNFHSINNLNFIKMSIFNDFYVCIRLKKMSVNLLTIHTNPHNLIFLRLVMPSRKSNNLKNTIGILVVRTNRKFKLKNKRNRSICGYLATFLSRYEKWNWIVKFQALDSHHLLFKMFFASFLQFPLFNFQSSQDISFSLLHKCGFDFATYLFFTNENRHLEKKDFLFLFFFLVDCFGFFLKIFVV